MTAHWWHAKAPIESIGIVLWNTFHSSGNCLERELELGVLGWGWVRRRGCWVVFSAVRGLGEGKGGGIHNGRQCYGLLQI